VVFSIVCLLAVTAINSVCAVELVRNARQLRALDDSLRRLARQRAEQRRVGEPRAPLAQTQRLAEGTVHDTTAAVRSLHKTIADIPFGILERIPVTRSTARIVRNLHDRTANGVYGTISTVNRLVGRVARAGLASAKSRPMHVSATSLAAPAAITTEVKPDAVRMADFAAKLRKYPRKA